MEAATPSGGLGSDSSNGLGRYFALSVAEEVCGYQTAGYGVDGQGGLFEGDYAEQTGLVRFGEYDRRVELQSLESDDGFADIDRDNPAVGGLRWQ